MHLAIELNPKFEIGQTVFKVCKKCYDCKDLEVGCGIGCKVQYEQTVIETQVDGYEITKKGNEYIIKYHLTKGSPYVHSYEDEACLYINRQDAEKSIINSQKNNLTP